MNVSHSLAAVHNHLGVTPQVTGCLGLVTDPRRGQVDARRRAGGGIRTLGLFLTRESLYR